MSGQNNVMNEFWPVLKKAFKYIPFVEELVAAYFCAFDKSTPSHVRWVLISALVYFISPIDIIPDFLIPFGYGDDAALLFYVIRMVRSHIRPIHYAAANKILSDNPDLHS